MNSILFLISYSIYFILIYYLFSINNFFNNFYINENNTFLIDDLCLLD